MKRKYVYLQYKTKTIFNAYVKALDMGRIWKIDIVSDSDSWQIDR